MFLPIPCPVLVLQEHTAVLTQLLTRVLSIQTQVFGHSCPALLSTKLPPERVLWYRVPCSPGCPQTLYVAEDDFELLILMSPPLVCQKYESLAAYRGKSSISWTTSAGTKLLNYNSWHLLSGVNWLNTLISVDKLWALPPWHFSKFGIAHTHYQRRVTNTYFWRVLNM